MGADARESRLMATQSYIIIDADARTGRRLAAARDAVEAEDKARVFEAAGYRVAITEGRPLPVRTVADTPEGYRRLDPRPLAESTRKREPERWRAEARTFPIEWDRWGKGHTTANVAYACLDRGLVEIAVPIKGHKPYLYRQKRNAR